MAELVWRSEGGALFIVRRDFIPRPPNEGQDSEGQYADLKETTLLWLFRHPTTGIMYGSKKPRPVM